MQDEFDETLESSSEIDLTPMLDVVFIMLIFFIVTTSFVRESGLEINRPDAASASAQGSDALYIAVGPDGQVVIDGKTVASSAVRAWVARMQVTQPDAPVIVQADRLAPAGVVVAVIDQAKLAGASKVAMAANKGEQ